LENRVQPNQKDGKGFPSTNTITRKKKVRDAFLTIKEFFRKGP